MTTSPTAMLEVLDAFKNNSNYNDLTACQKQIDDMRNFFQKQAFDKALNANKSNKTRYNAAMRCICKKEEYPLYLNISWQNEINGIDYQIFTDTRRIYYLTDPIKELPTLETKGYAADTKIPPAERIFNNDFNSYVIANLSVEQVKQIIATAKAFKSYSHGKSLYLYALDTPDKIGRTFYPVRPTEDPKTNINVYNMQYVAQALQVLGTEDTLLSCARKNSHLWLKTTKGLVGIAAIKLDETDEILQKGLSTTDSCYLAPIEVA